MIDSPCLLRDKTLKCRISRARAGEQTPKFSTLPTIVKTSTEYEAYETEIRLSLDYHTETKETEKDNKKYFGA